MDLSESTELNNSSQGFRSKRKPADLLVKEISKRHDSYTKEFYFYIVSIELSPSFEFTDYL